MKHVQQKAYYDCGVACIAMLAGKSYDEVWPYFKRFDFNNEEDMLNHMMLRVVLRDLGCRVYESEEDFDDSIQSIVIVPSLNHEGEDHAVCWDGEKVLDPCDGIDEWKVYDTELFKASPKFAQFIPYEEESESDDVAPAKKKMKK